MSQSTTLTLKIVNDNSVLDTLPQNIPLTDAQKDLIRFIAREAVREYIIEERERLSGIDRILRLPEVKRISGLSHSTIYNHINQGTFPKPQNLGGRSVGWKESEIREWMNKPIN